MSAFVAEQKENIAAVALTTPSLLVGSKNLRSVTRHRVRG